MSHLLPPEQQAIRSKCFHPSGVFVEFRKEEIEQSIPDRFERIVATYPDRLAIKYKNDGLTYDELNKAANRVARTILAKYGERRESVALLVQQGVSLGTAILGVLKAGKICVPLDPALPLERNSYMVQDSQAGLILTSNENLSVASKLAQHGCPLINVDEIEVGAPSHNLGLSIPPDTPAHILYTSGSTGQPKGVIRDHRNWLHSVMNYTDSLHVCPDDRISSGAYHLFYPLLVGAAFYPFHVKEGGLAPLIALLIEEGITIFVSVRSIFRHLAATLAGEQEFPHLRVVQVGGEPLCKTDVDLYKKYCSSNCLLVNLLGSQEALSIRKYFIDKRTEISGNTVPVGYLVEDKEVLLLDDDGKEVGFNQVGEIVVKSRYLSPGYWRRPDLTQKAFSCDPEGGGERIYRTGDLGFMLSDGCLLHLGRKDFQVKVRGNKVEPAEIEMALLNLDTVKEAVVVAKRDEVGDHCLVAYVVPNEKPGVTASALRRALAEKLPDFMVPSAFVLLDALPLTPSGKVDRKALPPPGGVRPELQTSFVSPRTPVEEVLAGIWSEVLAIGPVGIHDNFFDLGGHSLAATRVVSQVIKQFQLEIPLQSLFESPTVAQMAEVIAAHRGNSLSAEELEHVLAGVELMTEEEAKKLLAAETRTGQD